MSATDPPAPLAIFDCQLFLQAALRNTGPAAACFELVDCSRICLVLSHAVMAEVQDVLARPRLLRKYPQLASPRVAMFLARVAELAQLIEPVPEVLSYPRDPKAQPYLDLAIAADADFLVSRDQDLLDLQASDSEFGHELRRCAPQLTIRGPVELIRRMAVS